MEEFKTKAQVHNHALKIVGKKVIEVNNGQSIAKTKSGVGDAFENWFGKKKDSDSQPDMQEAGVELKATPIKRNKNGSISAKERLVLNIINYEEVVKESFENSHFLHKNSAIELAFYEWVAELSKDDYIFTDVALFEMAKNKADFEIIKRDWHIIDQYIKDGKAHELSERLTTYLSPCTKGASAKSVRKQPFSDIMAKQRAYSFKNGFMTYLYNTYILGKAQTEAIVTNPIELQEKSLEEIIFNKFQQYIGKTQEELMDLFGVNKQKAPKARNPEIVKGILGLKGNYEQAQEIQKANISVKTIVVNKGAKTNKEEFKLCEYKFKDVIRETWEDSELREHLQDTKFLLVVFERDGDIQTFKGVKFWEMPEEDIEGAVRRVWEDTVEKIKTGVEITYTGNKHLTNFINSSVEDILFSKLSASQTSYQKDSPHVDELPADIYWRNIPVAKENDYSDRYMTKQAWWLNKKYMFEVISDLL
ncbi:MAG: DNA mismatch repair protein MutH [Streptococcaceae bacterium]|nr:DNA mismatch repair protein MutH [Streptococcaceae bacterium]